MPRSARLLRTLGYTSAATTFGAGGLYIIYRSRTRVESEATAVRLPDLANAFRRPDFPSLRSREEQISDLKSSSTGKLRRLQDLEGRLPVPQISDPSAEQHEDIADEIYDLLVIGGGATGAGIALDAQTRGLRVILVERDDFSSGTSSKSTKMVHGGVRYLDKAFWELDYSQFKLVQEGLRERKYFLDIAPHLSSWLPIMIPLSKWWEIPYYWAGVKLYDFIAGSENMESSYYMTRKKALDAFPMLKKSGLVGALVYYDGSHNDSRMNVSLATTAAIYGCTVLNYMEVTSLTRDDNGKLNGACVMDRIADLDGSVAEETHIRARGVINATGPFCDNIRKLDDQTAPNITAPSAGVHIILPGHYSPAKIGLIDPKTSDGRVLFYLPWHGHTLVGTTDAPCDIEQNPIAGEEEISWIIEELRKYLQPGITLGRDDVLSAWSGIRPLVRDPNKSSSEGLVRNHLITTSSSGLITISGGKWTTYRQMAEEAVDEAIIAFGLTTRSIRAANVSGLSHLEDDLSLDGSCQTHNIKLIGAHGWNPVLYFELIHHFGLEQEVAKHLTTAYGDRSWEVASLCGPTGQRYPLTGKRLDPLYPFVDGEVKYAVRHEYAQTAVDVLARRTRLAFLNVQAALDALPRVIDLMTCELGWSRLRQEAEWNHAMKFLSSMGLPKDFIGLSRQDVEDGHLARLRSDPGVSSDVLRSSSSLGHGQKPILAVNSAANK